jgi:toxin ParE1/3/4
MTIEIRFRPEAEADVLEAHAWYRERGLGLAEEFLRSLDASLDLIRRLPESHPMVHRQVRRALLQHFPYGIFYVLEGNTVTVLACFHASRDPRGWKQRTKS